MVMYGGMVVESGPTPAVFAHMAHPYTRGLFGARPRLGAARGARLSTISGSVPELADLPAGCPFFERCAFAVAACASTRPLPSELGQSHQASCLRLDAVSAGQAGDTP
jgi:peptide/nickel transport system ATP-binding protein